MKEQIVACPTCIRPEQRSNTHGVLSLFRKKLICRVACSRNAETMPRWSAFSTSRHYVAHALLFARFIKSHFIHGIFVSGFRGVSHAIHDGFLIPTRNLPFFRICTQSSDDCVSANFREITKRTARCIFELRRGFRLKRWIALPTKNDVPCVNKETTFSFRGAS